MKKIIAFPLYCLLCAIPLLTACDDSKNTNSSIIGKWEFAKAVDWRNNIVPSEETIIYEYLPTGEMNYYFNGKVDETYTTYRLANGQLFLKSASAEVFYECSIAGDWMRLKPWGIQQAITDKPTVAWFKRVK